MKIFFPKNNFFTILFLILNLLLTSTIFAQTVGDYRSAGTGNWTTLSSWQYYNGSGWVTPSGTSPQGYPGQFTGTGSVLIQTGHTITLSATITTLSFGTLTITGRLTLTGDNSSGGMDFYLTTQSIIVTPSSGFIEFNNKLNLRLPVDASLQVTTGGLDVASGCSANQIIYIDTTAYAKCNGGGSLPDFTGLMNSGGTLYAIATSNSPVCQNNSINLFGSHSGVYGKTTSGGSTSGVNYSWSIKDPNNVITTSSSQNPNFAASLSGNYSATLTCTTYYGTALFTNSKTISVVVNAGPSAPTIGAITQPTCTTATGSVAISGLPGTWTLTRSGTSSATTSGTGASITISGLATGTYTYTVFNGTCTSVSSSSVAINAQPSTPVQPTLNVVTQPTCTTSTGSFIITNYNASYTYTISPSTGVTISGSTVTAPTGSYTLTATLGTCISASSSSIAINTQPATPVQPTLNVATQPTCTTSTGSFTITNYNASYTYAVSPSSAGVTISGNTVTAPTGSYTLTATLGTCISVASSSVTINNQVSNTWNGSVWSTGSAPTSSEKIVFDGFYSSAANINACSCQVNSGKSVTILSGGTLKITNEVTVLGTGTLTFENNSSLVQINDAATNTGNITYRRQTTPIGKFDYTYWSSPVSPQTLYNVSPNTLYDKFFSFDAATDNWKQENSANNMITGIGYIIRGPENYAAPKPPGLYEATFKGVPNNGIITTPIGGLDSSNLIGNPYPSALDADSFLTTNSVVLDGTLYFWTHNTDIQLATNITDGSAGSGDYAYTSDDYASYNLTGGVGIQVGGTGNYIGTVEQTSNRPSGKIASGQVFFATGKAVGNATFNNSMRVGVGGITGDNSQFFKMANSKTTSLIEKHRIWLNLTNTQGAFKQTLLGYVANATNGYDNSFDGESFDGNQFVDFYSVNEDKNLTIQGRALPFDENDVVSLGFSSTIEGIFSIGIDEVDGLFTSQDVFIEDKNTNSIKSLKDGPYTFTTESGTFNDRFVLRYTNINKTLDTGSFETLEKTVLVSNKNKLIKINSPVEMINKIQVYDLLGRKIYEKLNVDTNELVLSNLVVNHQVVLVKIALENGKTVIKKIIY